MWLAVFKNWLERLQAVFDEEWKLGYLHKEGWSDKATADGILAFKLAVQTGHVDHPVDMTQVRSIYFGYSREAWFALKFQLGGRFFWNSYRAIG